MKTTKIFTAVAVFTLSCTCAMAGSVTIPNTFVAGDPAVAQQVNDNFTAVKTAVDGNDTRLTTVEGTAAANETTIGNHATRLSTVEGSVTTNTSDISTNTSGVSANAAEIGINQSNIAVNAVTIATKQDVVTGSCTPGNAIRQVDPSGTVTCEPIPTANGAAVTGSGTFWVQLTATSGALRQITVTAPSDGQLMVTAAGTLLVGTITGDGGYCLALSEIADSTAFCVPSGVGPAMRGGVSGSLPVTASGHSVGYSFIGVYPVTQGTSYTYYLNGYANSGISTDTWLFQPTMTALFVPNSL